MSSDRVCGEVTACGPVEYERSPPSQLMHDRVCAPLTTCNDTTAFEVEAPTSTSDRRCQQHRQPCATVPVDSSMAAATTEIPTTTAEAAATTLPTFPCADCALLSDIFDSETCDFFRDNSMCETHVDSCQRTCCTPCPTTTPTLCGRCEEESDDFDSESCEWIKDQDGGCEEYPDGCRQTCCTEPLSCNPMEQGMTMMMNRRAAATEFEASPPTLSSDRTCTAFSTCDETQFEAGAPTFSTGKLSARSHLHPPHCWPLTTGASNAVACSCLVFLC